LKTARESLPTTCPPTACRRELQTRLARCVGPSKLRPPDTAPGQPGGVWGTLRKIVGADPAASDERLLGFIGVWLMVGEAHIVTLAVRESCRRIGIGERLIISCIELAMEAEQEVVTLEVRKSNDVAQRLYEKYGFDRVGLRVRYYTDNNEDAVLMTTRDLFSPSYRARFFRLREEHRARYPDLWT